MIKMLTSVFIVLFAINSIPTHAQFLDIGNDLCKLKTKAFVIIDDSISDKSYNKLVSDIKMQPQLTGYKVYHFEKSDAAELINRFHLHPPHMIAFNRNMGIISEADVSISGWKRIKSGLDKKTSNECIPPETDTPAELGDSTEVVVHNTTVIGDDHTAIQRSLSDTHPNDSIYERMSHEEIDVHFQTRYNANVEVDSNKFCTGCMHETQSHDNVKDVNENEEVYKVQFGVFRDMDNANKISTSHSQHDTTVVTETMYVVVSNKTFKSSNEAKQWVQKNGITKAKIVKAK